MGITKCLQTKENIIRMAKTAFPERGIPEIEELIEGMCNVAYKLTYEDGFRTILKIASPIKSGFLTNECNLMDAEVMAMKLVARNTDIKVPEVYTYDTTKTLCEGDYFFMECLEGSNWISVMESLAEDVNVRLRRKTGVLQKQLTAISNDKFGLLGDIRHEFAGLFDFIYFLINNVLHDAEKRGVVIGVPKNEIIDLLTKDKSVSRDKHAIVLYEPKTHIFLVQPGEARELCYLNDQVVLSTQELKRNDVITVGESKLMFFPCCDSVFNWDSVKGKDE